MKFSILIPAYKGRFLKECLDSIVKQTYKDWEAVVVNDASPENLREIVESVEDERIKYYENEIGYGGRNVVGNWNKCLKLSQGEYVLCMGDDDMLKENCLADYVALIDKYKYLDVYHTRTEMVDEKGELVDMQSEIPERESVWSLIWNIWKGRDQYIGDFLFYRKSLVREGGFYNLPYAWSSDKVTVVNAAMNNGIASTQRPGFVYRKSGFTITNSSDNLQERYEALEGEREYLRKILRMKMMPEKNLDRQYYMLVVKNMEKIMADKMEGVVYWDVTENPDHYKYWKRKLLDREVLRHAHFISIKEKFKRLIYGTHKKIER